MGGMRSWKSYLLLNCTGHNPSHRQPIISPPKFVHSHGNCTKSPDKGAWANIKYALWIVGECQWDKVGGKQGNSGEKKMEPVVSRKVNPVGRWRRDERGERIAGGIATGGDMVKESTESPVRGGKKGKKIGSKWKGRRKKRQKERENKEAWRLCLLAQSAIIPPPPLLPLTSPSGLASLYRAKTQVSILHTHKQSEFQSWPTLLPPPPPSSLVKSWHVYTLVCTHRSK